MDNVLLAMRSNVLMEMYHAKALKNFKPHISALYSQLDDGFIWENSLENPCLYVTGSDYSEGEDVMLSILEKLSIDYATDMSSSKINEGAPLFLTFDCSEIFAADLKVLESLPCVTFVSIYNVQDATNESLLWLSNWMREYPSNFIVTLEAKNNNVSNDVVLAMDVVYPE